MKHSSLLHRFLALPATRRWQFVRSFVGLVAAFAILVSSIRWYRINYLPVADIWADVPDATKYGNVAESLRRSQILLDALAKVNYEPWRVPNDLQHLPDEAMSESRHMFGRSKETSDFAFPGLASSRDMRNITQEIAFSNNLYVRNHAKAYNDDVVKTHPTSFVIVGWKNGKVTTVPIEDVRIALLSDKPGWTEVYPGMKAYDPNGLHIPALEFGDGKNTPRFKAFLKRTMSTDDTGACRAPVKTK